MAERRRQWQGRQLEQAMQCHAMPCYAMPVWPKTCGLVLIGTMMRFAERTLGRRLGGYMCREFVGSASVSRQLVGVAIIEQHIERQEVGK